ncbi:hypothetical protein BT96DRAFT_773500, partial [Gymnopus androsaceus JB14]
GSTNTSWGAGLFFGVNNSLNKGLRVPGPFLSTNRAHAFAVWEAIRTCPVNRPLILYTTSDFVVGALTHYADRNAKSAWSCANGDLLRSITMRIRERDASIHLFLLPDWSRNKHLAEALSLASKGA